MDISKYVSLDNNITVHGHYFFGNVVAEINQTISVDTFYAEVLKRNTDSCHRCNHCLIYSPDLRRCSACKEAWYCNEDHQLQDWNARHSRECSPHDTTPPSSPKRGLLAFRESLHQEDSEDEIEEVDQIISLKCPISIDIIKTPARGSNCDHVQCFDLMTFLQLAHNGHSWQCPVCLKPLEPQCLMVDSNFERIILQAPKDSEKIRLLQDGHYEYIREVSNKRHRDGEPDQHVEGLEDSDDDAFSDEELPRYKHSRLEELLDVVSMGGSQALPSTAIGSQVAIGTRDEPIELD